MNEKLMMQLAGTCLIIFCTKEKTNKQTNKQTKKTEGGRQALQGKSSSALVDDAAGHSPLGIEETDVVESYKVCCPSEGRLCRQAGGMQGLWLLLTIDVLKRTLKCNIRPPLGINHVITELLILDIIEGLADGLKLVGKPVTPAGMNPWNWWEAAVGSNKSAGQTAHHGGHHSPRHREAQIPEGGISMKLQQNCGRGDNGTNLPRKSRADLLMFTIRQKGNPTNCCWWRGPVKAERNRPRGEGWWWWS